MADQELTALTDITSAYTVCPTTGDLYVVVGSTPYHAALSTMPFLRYLSTTPAEYSLPMMGTGGGGQTTLKSNLVSDVTGNNLYVPGTLKYHLETEEVTAANSDIAVTESGKTYFLDLTAGFASTVPAVASSDKVTYRFVVKTAPSGGSYTIVTASSELKIYGSVVAGGTAVAASAEHTITFADGVALPGDWVEIICDGEAWYVSGQGAAAGAITFSAA